MTVFYRDFVAAWSACDANDAFTVALCTLDGPVDGGAPDAEQLGQFAHGVLLGGIQLAEVSLLAGCELRGLPAQPPLGLGDLHPFAGAGADEVGFEFGDHRQHVEQQLAHRVGRVVHRPRDTELHVPGREVISDLMGVAHGTGESIELGDYEGVGAPAGRQRLPQPITVRVAALSP